MISCKNNNTEENGEKNCYSCFHINYIVFVRMLRNKEIYTYIYVTMPSDIGNICIKLQ